MWVQFTIGIEKLEHVRHNYMFNIPIDYLRTGLFIRACKKPRSTSTVSAS